MDAEHRERYESAILDHQHQVCIDSGWLWTTWWLVLYTPFSWSTSSYGQVQHLRSITFLMLSQFHSESTGCPANAWHVSVLTNLVFCRDCTSRTPVPCSGDWVSCRNASNAHVHDEARHHDQSLKSNQPIKSAQPVQLRWAMKKTWLRNGYYYNFAER